MVCYHPREEGERDESREKGRKARLLSLRCTAFEETMKETSHFITSIFYIIYGRKAEFPSKESKINVCMVSFQGEKCSIGKMRPSI